MNFVFRSSKYLISHAPKKQRMIAEAICISAVNFHHAGITNYDILVACFNHVIAHFLTWVNSG
jgi:hypothetical protein